MTAQLTDLSALLKAHHIRPTKIRQDILKLFFEVNYALSQADIIKRLDEHFDRVTVYRTLEIFQQKNLVHKVLDNSGVTKFASHDFGGCDVNFKHHKNNHLHFKCTECGNIYCMCSIEVPDIVMPDEVELKTITFSAEGICKHCLKKNSNQSG